jgi:hypothetical protein
MRPGLHTAAQGSESDFGSACIELAQRVLVVSPEGCTPHVI